MKGKDQRWDSVLHSKRLNKDQLQGKEKNFISHDSNGTVNDFDYVGFHLDTIEDIFKLISICREEIDEQVIPTTKFDELRQYTTKLKRYVGGDHDTVKIKEIVELTKQVDDLISDNVDLKHTTGQHQDEIVRLTLTNEDTKGKGMEIVNIYKDGDDPHDVIVMEIEDNTGPITTGYIRKIYLDNHVDNRRLLRSWDINCKKQQS